MSASSPLPRPPTSPAWNLTRDPVFQWGLVAIALLFAIGSSLPVGTRWSDDDVDLGYGTDCGRGGRTEVFRSLDGRTRIRVDQGRCRLEAKIRGDVELVNDLGEIGLGRGARLEIEERLRREERRMVVVAGADGEPEYQWLVDDEPREVDEAARTWLRESLTRLLRVTGFEADRRVARLLAAGGLRGVLDEIREIHADGVQRAYFEELFRQVDEASDDDLERAIELAGKEIRSDYELAELLAAVPRRHLGTAAAQRAFARACRSIGSDYEMRRALTALLASEPGPEGVDALLETSRQIGADYELAELLVEVAETLPKDRPLPPRFADALEEIGADSEHRRALSAGLERSYSDPEAFRLFLEAAIGIDHDYEMAELLTEVARRLPSDQALPAAFFRAADTIVVDYEQRRVLGGVVQRRALELETVRSLLETAQGIGSDYELASLLVDLAERHGISPDLREPFERTLDLVGSKIEAERVREALREAPPRIEPPREVEDSSSSSPEPPREVEDASPKITEPPEVEDSSPPSPEPEDEVPAT